MRYRELYPNILTSSLPKTHPLAHSALTSLSFVNTALLGILSHHGFSQPLFPVLSFSNLFTQPVSTNSDHRLSEHKSPICLLSTVKSLISHCVHFGNLPIRLNPALQLRCLPLCHLNAAGEKPLCLTPAKLSHKAQMGFLDCRVSDYISLLSSFFSVPLETILYPTFSDI